MPLKKVRTDQVPWDLTIEDKKYQEEPWILKKGKESVTIGKNKSNRGDFYIQKDNERRLSLDKIQARSTYHQLIDFGYKLQKKTKRKKTVTSPQSEFS